MRHLFFVLGWILLAVGAALLVAPFLDLPSTVPTSVRSAEPASAAAVIVIAGLIFTLRQQMIDKADARSRFYLEEWRKSYDVAYELLSSTNKGHPLLRMKWLAAARILEAADRMAANITVRAHHDVMMATIPHESQRFQQFLRHPAEYYYGTIPEMLAGWPAGERLNEAARRATVERDGVMNAHIEIPVGAIYTVWRAIQYPSEFYLELMDRFPNGLEEYLDGQLREYVGHSRRYSSIHGVLYDQGGREIPRPSVEMGPNGREDYVGPQGERPAADDGV